MSTTVVVAREFRGTRLYLTSAKPREFTWSDNRQLALPVSVEVALRIMHECEDFSRGTDAFAIDSNDCVIAEASNGSVRRLRDGGYRLLGSTDERQAGVEPKNVKHCRLCEEHYKDGTDTCDLGMPVSSPHRKTALMRRQAE